MHQTLAMETAANRESAGLRPPRLRVRVFLNATSGLFPQDRAEQTRAAFARYPDVECQVWGTDRPEHLKRQIDKAVASGVDVIVAGGGDGTVSLVAGALAHKPIILGVLPLGTFNHFAKDLGLPLDLEQAIAVICQGRTATIDVGEVNGRYFVNSSWLGVYPLVIRIRDRWRKYVGKWPAMLLAWTVALWNLPALFVDLVWPGGRRKGLMLLLSISNNRYSLAWPELGHRERLDAGRLGLVLIHMTKLHRVLHAGWLALTKRKHAHEIETLEVEALRVRARRRRLTVSLDGETVILASPLKYRIHPAALQVRLPAQNHEHRA